MTLYGGNIPQIDYFRERGVERPALTLPVSCAAVAASSLVCHHCLREERPRQRREMGAHGIFGLVRWGALGLMFGGAVWLVLGLSAVLGHLQAVPGREDVVLLFVALLLMAGLVGLHALQWPRYGFFGRAGLFIALASLFARALGAGVCLAGSSARRGVLSSAYRSQWRAWDER